MEVPVLEDLILQLGLNEIEDGLDPVFLAVDEHEILIDVDPGALHKEKADSRGHRSFHSGQEVLVVPVHVLQVIDDVQVVEDLARVPDLIVPIDKDGNLVHRVDLVEDLGVLSKDIDFLKLKRNVFHGDPNPSNEGRGLRTVEDSGHGRTPEKVG